MCTSRSPSSSPDVWRIMYYLVLISAFLVLFCYLYFCLVLCSVYSCRELYFHFLLIFCLCICTVYWVSSCVFVFSCAVWGACHIGLCLQATLLARQEKFGQVKSNQVLVIQVV